MSKNETIYSDPVRNMLTVMENCKAYNDVMDVDSYYAGNYSQMCMLSDFLYKNGYNFLYDPRELEIITERFDNHYYWYEIKKEGNIINSGYNHIDKNKDPEHDIFEKWDMLDKSPVLTETQRRLVRLMWQPRDIRVKRKHLKGFNLSEIVGGDEINDYIIIPASFITLFDLTGVLT